MPKNLVVCCDGTGNEYGDRNSNVVRLYSVLERGTPRQVGFYDPGVGTFSVNPALTGIARATLRTLGAAFGLGITKNVLDAYGQLMRHYEEGDRIFLFGFSRGAYTARAVAAMLHKCGLLDPLNDNLTPYASKMFKREQRKSVYEGFRDTFGRPCPVHFLGLWDTVTSVGWVWDPVSLPWTTNNPSVSVVRHAISIDERRAFFRQNLWGKPREGQDVLQVWFAGVHSDVGGSYPEGESGLSQIAFEWMLVEALRNGLEIDAAAARALLAACPPDPRGPMHRSLRGMWWPAELWPKLYRDPRDEFRRKPRLNRARPRRIPAGACVHASVAERMRDLPDYRPPNLPAEHRLIPQEALDSVLRTQRT